jgi:hypothetical protein
MAGRLVDFTTYPRRTSAPNGHMDTSRVDLPVLSMGMACHATQHFCGDAVPERINGFIYLSLDADDTYSLKVTRAGDRHSLILQGDHLSGTAPLLREILCWLFGVPA